MKYLDFIGKYQVLANLNKRTSYTNDDALAVLSILHTTTSDMDILLSELKMQQKTKKQSKAKNAKKS